MVHIFPELSSTTQNLRDNRKYWDEQHLREIENNVDLSSSDVEEEKKKARQRSIAFFNKYKDVFEVDLKKTASKSF